MGKTGCSRTGGRGSECNLLRLLLPPATQSKFRDPPDMMGLGCAPHLPTRTYCCTVLEFLLQGCGEWAVFPPVLDQSYGL